MDSGGNKSCTKDNTTEVFELIITNPCSEPSEPVDISCVINHRTAKTNTLDTVVGKDGLTDSDPIVIDDVDNEEATNTNENSFKDDAQKSIEANTDTSNNIKISVPKITFDCNDNQKESMESLIILDETNTGDLTKLSSSQLITKNVVKNNNRTTDSDIDLYETELQAALDPIKTDSECKVRDKHHKNAVDTNTGSKQQRKAVCSDNIAKKDDTTTDSDIDFYETESQNLETGNREDSDVLVLDDKTSSENTIIQHDNEIQISAKEYPPIDLVAEGDLSNSNVISVDYADEFKENSLLSELVQKCLSMERNGGMSRVINRTLLYIYKSVDEKYKKSDSLRKMLTKTIMNLHLEPQLKFSHIKCLCDHLKLHMVKKRVPFVTLQKRSTGDQSTSSIPSKKSRVETIDLDNYGEKNQTAAPRKPKEYPPIEIEDSSSSIEEVHDIIPVDKEKAKKKKKKTKKKKQKKKKGELTRAFIPTLVRNPFCTAPDLSYKEIPTSNESERIPLQPNLPVSTHRQGKQISSLQTECTTTQIQDFIEEPLINTQPLLTPVMIEPVPLYSGNSDQLDEAWKKNEIEIIEKNIAYLRKTIEMLEEMEVQVDDERSPYIVCEHYQSLLVKQYKRLCELTGTQEKKQHKVRLQVLPGHPEAPVRYLQEFLNNNIDEEGNPPFPDLYDVIQCVSKANDDCRMHWGQAHIMKEARSLFIQFGQTMQKRRQKREWKDLMSRVKEEVNDPAEQDAELMMKLNRNSWIAKQNEAALLDRYAGLEATGLNVRMANELSIRMENGVSEPETESSDDENVSPHVPYSSIRTDDRQDNIGNPLPNGNIGILQTNDSTNNQRFVGSTISTLNGHIEIAPTYMQNSCIVLPNGVFPTKLLQINSNNTFGVTSTPNTTLNTFIVNGIQNVTSTENIVSQCHNDLSMYSLEFQKFTSNLAVASRGGKCNLCTGVQSKVCYHNTNVSTVNNPNIGTAKSTFISNLFYHNTNVSAVNNNLPPVNNSNVTTVNNSNVNFVNNSNVTTVNNSNVTTINNSNATSVNNSRVTTVNTVGTENSDKLQSKVVTDYETATNLAKTIMELVKNDISPKTTDSKKKSEEIANSHDLTKTTDVKVKEESNETNYESVCDIFTHKTKATHKNTVDENRQVEETSIETKSNLINVPNQANVETSSEIETKDVPIEDIVKPEPLDIHRILAEFGDEYTAEVFDIEDPFLVIEISDSSESEDEVT